MECNQGLGRNATNIDIQKARRSLAPPRIAIQIRFTLPGRMRSRRYTIRSWPTRRRYGIEPDRRFGDNARYGELSNACNDGE